MNKTDIVSGFTELIIKKYNVGSVGSTEQGRNSGRLGWKSKLRPDHGRGS